MVDLAVAFALITTPTGVPETSPPADRWVQLAPAIQKVAISMELLDVSESSYILIEAKEFNQDINIIRQRYTELNDAPAASECYRFPDRSAINGMIQFNRLYVSHVRKLRNVFVDRADEYDEVIEECEQIYRILDTARDSRCDYYHVTVRRKALKQLREMLGDEDYQTGRLPCCVPEWRFAER